MSGKPVVEAFTDGACSGNPGPGGWGVLLRMGGHEKELFGGEKATTNQRMEMRAAIEALKALKKPCRITIHSDSRYVVQGMSEWIHGWKKTAGRTPAENLSPIRICGRSSIRSPVGTMWSGNGSGGMPDTLKTSAPTSWRAGASRAATERQPEAAATVRTALLSPLREHGMAATWQNIAFVFA